MSKHSRSSRRAASIRVALVAVMAGVALGCWALTPNSTATGSAAPPAGAAATPTANAPPPVGAARGAELRGQPVLGAAPVRSAATAAGVPVRLRIPAIGVDAPLERLALRADGTLTAPSQWDVPGWYAGGPRPGDAGPAVIAGHIDSRSGPAVFFGLSHLRAGDAVYVTERPDRVLRFIVDDIHSFAKKRFPSAFVYGPQPVPVLRLITCTGVFDAAQRSYLDNLVVSGHLG